MADRIRVVVDADADPLIRELRRAGVAVGGFGGALRAQSRGAEAFNAVLDQQRRNLGFITTWGKRAAIGLTAAFAAGATAGLKLNAQWESLNTSFTTFLGSAEQAAKFMEQLRETSLNSPLRLTEYAEAAQLLLGFEMEAKKVIPLLDAVNDAVVASGKGSEEMMQVVLALGQMEAKGKASAEELNQLAEAGIPVHKILQRELGLTGEQVQNIGEEGVKAKDAIAAIARGWRQQFGDAADNARNDFSFQLSGMRKDLEQMLRLGFEEPFEALRDDVFPRVREEMQGIIDILKRDIPFDRKIELMRRQLDRLADEVGELDLDDKLIEAFNEGINAAAPVIGEQGGRLAFAMLTGFGRGFAESDLLGKLFLGGLFIRYLGGWKLFGILGRRMGAEMGIAMGTSMGTTAAGTARAGIAAKFARTPIVIPVAIALVGIPFLQELEDQLKDVLGDSTFDQMFPDFTDHLEGLGVTTREKLGEVSLAIGDGAKQAAAQSEKYGKVKDNFRKAVDPLPGLAGRSGAGINRQMLPKLDQLKDQGGQKSDAFAGRLSGSFGNLDTNVGEALGSIMENTRRALEAFGVKGALQKFALKHPNFVYGTGTTPNAANKQRGGHINDGKPSGDSVPAMLERGEYVLNRNAVKVVGKDQLDAVNFGMARRFQQGGIVALGKQLQREGYEVGEHPAFGGVAPVHTSGSYHYRDQAIDVNDDAPPFASGGGEPGSLDRLYRRLQGMEGVVELLWRVSDHFNHLHVAMGKGASGFLGGDFNLPQLKLLGPDGPLKDLGQAGIDKARKAAMQLIASKQGAMAGMPHPDGGALSGGGAAFMRQLAAQRGWSFPAWWELDRRETSHGANLFNPTSTASLRGQFLDFNWGKYGPGSDPRQNPSMREQIISMARYISERYGNPTAALAHHDAHNWYQRGGLVEAMTGSPPPLEALASKIISSTPSLAQTRQLINKAWQRSQLPQRPGLHFTKERYPARKGTNAAGVVNIPQWQVPWLLSSRHSRMSDYVKSGLIHEFAHVSQKRSVRALFGGNKRLAEGGAELYANLAAPQIWHSLGYPFRNYPDSNYSGFVNWVREHKGLQWALAGQFNLRKEMAAFASGSTEKGGTSPGTGGTTAPATRIRGLGDDPGEVLEVKFGPLPNTVAGCTEELRARREQLGDLRKAMRRAKVGERRAEAEESRAKQQRDREQGRRREKDKKAAALPPIERPSKAMRERIRLIEKAINRVKDRIAKLIDHRGKLIKRGRAKAIGKIERRGSLPGWTKQILAARDRQERAQQFADQLVDLEPEEIDQAYIDQERGAYGAVLGKEAGWRNLLIGGQDRAELLIEQMKDQIAKIRKLPKEAFKKQRWRIPALRQGIQAAREKRGEFTGELGDVQGLGGTRDIIPVLPSMPEAGRFGGLIFGTQLEISGLDLKLRDGDDGRADELKQLRLDQALQELTAERLKSAQLGTLRDFLGEFGPQMPYIGAFMQGTGGMRVGRSGMAMLHRDEQVVPDPQGPAGSQLAGGGQSGPVNVALYVDGDIGPLMGKVRAEVDGRVAKIDQTIGRRGRQLSVAPGR